MVDFKNFQINLLSVINSFSNKTFPITFEARHCITFKTLRLTQVTT